ncbi:putative Glycine cleavage T-protein (aminomethyl transferase) [Prochlorococcus marinus str. MIT 9211]|uniref:aminomethyltransferase n=2 Tax=Prochlorococcus marinus TaxID=1219 RepID=A9BDD7_PROM4|nr:putative Glycine cleavage T-protein (aminomethyl transferase) [Prochlorococcus marinus str. MIT 9211]
MVSFAGWEMPIHFSGLVLEHHAVRKKAGIFDISHMGVLLIQGKSVKDNLQKLVPSDLYQIGSGEACYTVLLNKHGGIIDDLIIYDLGVNDQNIESLMLVINASCSDSDTNWIKANLQNQSISINDAKKDGVLLAVQGPDSEKSLNKIFGSTFEESISNLPRFGHRKLKLQFQRTKKPCPVFIAKTGYTGEEGYELLLEKEMGITLWEELVKSGVTPCGLGARDTLRLEAAMHLYGNDLNEETTPFEAGLGWLVHLEMPKTFIGREALEKQIEKGVSKLLVGLVIQDERAIARKGYEVIYENKPIGKITSGSWSPTLEKAIALAYIPKQMAQIGTEVYVKIRNKLHPAKVVKKPFYRRIS